MPAIIEQKTNDAIGRTEKTCIGPFKNTTSAFVYLLGENYRESPIGRNAEVGQPMEIASTTFTVLVLKEPK